MVCNQRNVENYHNFDLSTRFLKIPPKMYGATKKDLAPHDFLFIS